MQFQQLSLNLQPVHKDPRHKALVKIENCKLLVSNLFLKTFCWMNNDNFLNFTLEIRTLNLR